VWWTNGTPAVPRRRRRQDDYPSRRLAITSGLASINTAPEAAQSGGGRPPASPWLTTLARERTGHRHLPRSPKPTWPHDPQFPPDEHVHVPGCRRASPAAVSPTSVRLSSARSPAPTRPARHPRSGVPPAAWSGDIPAERTKSYWPGRGVGITAVEPGAAIIRLLLADRVRAGLAHRGLACRRGGPGSSSRVAP
jgi:hypothetical protein